MQSENRAFETNSFKHPNRSLKAGFKWCILICKLCKLNHSCLQPGKENLANGHSLMRCIEYCRSRKGNKMSKVDTLLSLITYQKQHPEASDSQMASGIGITPQYLKQCRTEVNLLKHHLFEFPLKPNQFRFVMSMLDRRDPDQREIYQQFQKSFLPPSDTGIIRTAHPNEKPPYGWLEIGELIPVETASFDELHPIIDFWLEHLCYDPLLRVRRDGEIEWRLATTLEPVKGDWHWRICLREDLCWSDGKTITPKDVIHTLSLTHLAPRITEMRTEGKNQLHIRLSQEMRLFPLHLHGIPIRPAHSTQPYSVTSGAYRLKHFSRSTRTFRFERNPDCYRQKDIGIDWITLKCFKHPANAIKSLLNQEIDLLPLRALQLFYQVSNPVLLQQWPFFEESYYILFLNRCRGPLSDKRNCRLLSQAIDYRAINRYLHAGQHADKKAIKSSRYCSLDLRLTFPEEMPTYSCLASIVGKSVGASVINPVPLKSESSQAQFGVRENIDAFLTKIHFGLGFSSLSQYFRSDGAQNPFSYANQHVDEMLAQLNQTTNMAHRRVIGQKVLSLLQEDFAVILLAPSVEYILSPVTIQFDEDLTSFADFAQNMSTLVVERNPVRSGSVPQRQVAHKWTDQIPAQQLADRHAPGGESHAKRYGGQ